MSLIVPYIRIQRPCICTYSISNVLQRDFSTAPSSGHNIDTGTPPLFQRIRGWVKGSKDKPTVSPASKVLGDVEKNALSMTSYGNDTFVQYLLQDRDALQKRLNMLLKKWPRIHTKQSAALKSSPENLEKILAKINTLGPKVDATTIKV
jgi:hypothetical protein